MKMNKILSKGLVASASLILFASSALAGTPKYVFYLIGDGMGINEVIGTQIYNKACNAGPEVVNFTQFPVRGFVTTHSASSLVTDSAAAGTALATGVKTYNDAMGVDMEKSVVSDMSEWIHPKGFGVGVSSCVGVNHATPAAFYAHAESRAEYEKIAMQLIETDNVDFAAGGGFINEARKTGHDSKYLEDKAAEAGITILHGKEQFKNLADIKGRVICFSQDPKVNEFPYAIDRTEAETGLPDVVVAGIDYLYGHFAEKGFFFMIEGGSIDHGGHDDDAVATFHEINDFAQAVDEVLKFYEKHPDETLIVVTSDHETGGLMLGAGEYKMNPELLAGQKFSESRINRMFRQLSNPTWDEVKAFFKENLGLWDLVEVSEAQEAVFKEMYDKAFGKNGAEENVRTLYSNNSKIVSEAVDYVDKQAGYHYGFGSHSGSPVGLYAKGAGAERFMECRDNTDIPKMIREVAGY